MQRHTRWLRSPMLLASLTMAGSMAVACNRSSENAPPRARTEPAPSVERPVEQTPTPVSVTGCLQKGSRDTYIVTTLNRPAHPDSSNPQVVAQEKQAAARDAYRLDWRQTDDLKKLLGKRVHVEGTLKKAASADVTLDTTAAAADASREIKQRDLAEVEVSSVQKVANNCGGGQTRAKARAKHS